MRAQTRGKHEIGKRLAILIVVAAVGVMALGVQTVLRSETGGLSAGLRSRPGCGSRRLLLWTRSSGP
jgi:hypothetical protein